MEPRLNITHHFTLYSYAQPFWRICCNFGPTPLSGYSKITVNVFNVLYAYFIIEHKVRSHYDSHKYTYGKQYIETINAVLRTTITIRQKFYYQKWRYRGKLDKNLSGDETANANFLRRHRTCTGQHLGPLNRLKYIC